MHYQLVQPISSALQLCALLEGVVRGTPSVPPALRSPVATRAAMRRLLYGRPVPLSSFEFTALRPTFADVTKTGTHVKCGFNYGFPFRDQKNGSSLHRSAKRRAKVVAARLSLPHMVRHTAHSLLFVAVDVWLAKAQ